MIRTTCIILSIMRLSPNNISLRQLRAFSAVARHRSFVAASKDLFITASALSETIRQLEEHVGVKLLDRTTRSVELTAPGEEFLHDVGQLLNQFDLALRRIDELGSAEKGLVRITGVASVHAHLTAPCVGMLMEKNPGIEFEISEDGTAAIVPSVLEGNHDIGVGVMPEGPLTGLHVVPLFSDRYGVIARRGHEALTMPSLTVDAIAAWNYISVPLGGELVGSLEAAQVKPRVRLNGFASMIPLLENGLGVSILPSLSARRVATPALAFRPFDQPRYFREVSMIRRKSRSLSPAAQLLWDDMLRSAPELLSGEQVRSETLCNRICSRANASSSDDRL